MQKLYFCIDKDGTELITNEIPVKNESTGKWHYRLGTQYLVIPKGSIEKLLGIKLDSKTLFYVNVEY